MAIYSINYDLKKSSKQKYDDVDRAIRLGLEACKVLNNFWLVECNKDINIKIIKYRLSEVMEKDDSYIISKVNHVEQVHFSSTVEQDVS